jgi:hypothetical protein
MQCRWMQPAGLSSNGKARRTKTIKKNGSPAGEIRLILSRRRKRERSLLLRLGLQTLHADLYPLVPSAGFGLDRPKVGAEETVVHVVGMRYASARAGTFPTYFAYICHNRSPDGTYRFVQSPLKYIFRSLQSSIDRFFIPHDPREAP